MFLAPQTPMTAPIPTSILSKRQIYRLGRAQAMLLCAHMPPSEKHLDWRTYTSVDVDRGGMHLESEMSSELMRAK